MKNYTGDRELTSRNITPRYVVSDMFMLLESLVRNRTTSTVSWRIGAAAAFRLVPTAVINVPPLQLQLHHTHYSMAPS